MNTEIPFAFPSFRELARVVLPCAIVFVTMSIATPVEAEVLSKSERIAGTTLRYKVILPNNYDPAADYPAVLAFPGGGQTMQIVDGMVARTLRTESEDRGYITVIAAAPSQGLFFEGGDIVFPAFLEKLTSDYKIRSGKFNIMGISNGGISAFHIAARYPSYFWTITGLPGYLRDPETYMSALEGMCVHLYVGENDEGWLRTMETESRMFEAKGIKTTFSIEAGQGHVMRTLQDQGAARLFDHFDAEPMGCRN